MVVHERRKRKDDDGPCDGVDLILMVIMSGRNPTATC